MSEKTAFQEVLTHYLLSAKQVARLLKVSIATANRRIKAMKEQYQLNKYEKISLHHVCDYANLEVNEALLAIL